MNERTLTSKKDDTMKTYKSKLTIICLLAVPTIFLTIKIVSLLAALNTILS